MEIVIKKRNGELQKYDDSKIYRAIESAMLEVSNNELEEDDLLNIETIISNIEDKLTEQPEYPMVNVEEIQDLVEFELMSEGYFNVAKTYILYREKKLKT